MDHSALLHFILAKVTGTLGIIMGERIVSSYYLPPPLAVLS